MKDCGIVKDLLPLYAEDMASEESAAFVKTHLETCEDCRKAFEELKAPVETEPAAPLKTVKKAVKKRGWLIAGLIACLVAALLLGAFARLTKPIPIHSVDEAFASVKMMPEIHSVTNGSDLYLTNVEIDPETGAVLIDGVDIQTTEKVLYLTHAESTHVKVENQDPEHYKSNYQQWLERWIPGEKIVVTSGSHEISIYAYTTLWDLMFSQNDTWAGFGITLTDNVDAVFFEPYDNTEREALYVRDGYPVEAGFALPRLVMNYYFAIALIGTVLLAAVWFVLRLLKKQKASRVFGVLLLIAASGVLAFLFAGFPATTIAPARELAFVCVIALFLIGAGLCGRKLLRKN